MKAQDMLRSAAQIIDSRATTRDRDGERSMHKTVSAFNALTGNKLSEQDGWIFMAVLKLARSQHGKDPDNFVDCAAYAALAGETLETSKNG